MKAAVIHRYGPPSELHVETVPRPRPGRGEVLVRAMAAGINPVDWKTREGGGVARRLNGIGFPLILGWDVAGRVAQVGEGVTELEAGDEVYGLVRFPDIGGAYAEYVTAPAAQLAPKPATLSFAEAAAVPLAGLTAAQAIFEVAGLAEGQRILITAGAGGVGQFAVQLAASAGARVTATASRDNLALLGALGADDVIDSTVGGFDADSPVYDVVLDLVGSPTTRAQAFSAVKLGGLVIPIPSPIDDAPAGIAVRNHLVHPDGRRLRDLAARIDRGELRVAVEHVFPLEDVARAHERSATGHTRGKLVLSLED
jgi:NADPH:quinone reductase-like Zn-dependent oxidoreductase